MIKEHKSEGVADTFKRACLGCGSWVDCRYVYQEGELSADTREIPGPEHKPGCEHFRKDA